VSGAVIPGQRVPRSRPTVLMYHGFRGDEPVPDPYDLHVSATDLARQLELLRRCRWTALDLDGYLRHLASGRSRRSYLVTVDDALCSVLEHAVPVLAAARVPALLFVPVGLVGRTTTWLDASPDLPVLDADGLCAVQDAGVELGVHGWDHARMAGMSDAELHRSTVEAREVLADLTGRVPRAFAYPYGDLDPRAVAAVAAAGYEVGFSVYRDRGRHALSRTDVKPADSLTALRVKLAAGPRYRAAWRVVGAAGPTRSVLRSVAQRH
jgi:peptidoglycan/xylan/chitin deacetylase (PgdA/CDA1 family)